jgi:hypothetical protein
MSEQPITPDNTSAKAAALKPPPPRLAFSVDEFAASIGASRAWCWEMVKSGELHVIRRGRRTFVTAGAAREFLGE